MRLSVVALPKPNRQGELSLYLRISHGAGAKRHVAIGFRVHRDDWNGRKGEVRRSAQEAHHLNQILANRRADAQPPYRLPRKARSRIQSVNALARKLMRGLTEREKVPYVGSHGARHSFADGLRQNGAPVYTISKALGHSPIAVTEASLAVFDQADVEAEMRSALGGGA